MPSPTSHLWADASVVIAHNPEQGPVRGGAKAGWILLIIFLPLFGILIYMIVRPRMTEGAREMAMSAAEAEASTGYSSPGHVG